MTVRRGTAEGQAKSWLEQISCESPTNDPTTLEIWGYTGRPSYAPHDSVDLHITTTADTWGFTVWRDGAEATEMYRVADLPGRHHATNPDPVANGCGWPTEASFTIPDHWPSGGYIIEFTAQRDGQETSHDGFFVLRAAEPGKNSRIALILATYSWQEYNDWGGGCGYYSDGLVDHQTGPDGGPASSFRPRLSFQRPWSRGMIRIPVGVPRLAQPPLAFNAAPGAPAVDWCIANGYSVWTVGNGWARYDSLTARWLEETGYHPEFLSQMDLDDDPSILDNYDVVITTGHDEYWTARGRQVLDDFITDGGRYVRLAGNILWQVRLEDDLTTLICFKYAADADDQAGNPDRRQRTGAFESLAIDNPPVTTFGANGLRGVYSRIGGASPRGPGGFIIYRPDHWAFANADAYYGDVVGSTVPLVGFETDGLAYTFDRGRPVPTGEDGTPVGDLDILALTPVTLEEEDHGHPGAVLNLRDGDLAFAAEALYGSDTPEHRDRCRYGSAVITHMTKGHGEVFCAGTTEWCYALAVGDPQVTAITRTVLDRFLGG